jgi:hypothetical protein
MTDGADDLYRISQYAVWVMLPNGTAATGYTFPWAWNRWRYEPRLIVEQFDRTSGNQGSATFRLLRQLRAEAEDNVAGDYTHLVIPKAYVAITAWDDSLLSGDQQLDETTVQWWGTIEEIPQELIESADDEVGSVHAREIGALWESTQMHGWRQLNVNTSDSTNCSPLNTPPTANIATRAGHIVSNAITGATFQGVDAGYAFARRPVDCCSPGMGSYAATLWTRWRLLMHATRFCKPQAWPTLNVRCSDGSPSSVPNFNPTAGASLAAYLNSTDDPEVYDITNVTWKGGVDLMVPTSFDLDWHVTCGKAGWTIVIDSAADSAAYGIPAATVNDLALGDLAVESLDIVESSSDVIDEVVVEGAPGQFAVTVGFSDGNLDQGYTDPQREDYESARPEERSQPQHEDVFQLFQLKHDSSGDLRRCSLPGDTGTDLPLVPQMEWDGTTLSLSTTSRCPYLPTARIMTTVPWQIGRKSDGTDTRSASNQNGPTYRRPQLFRYSAELFPKSYELTVRNDFIDEIPQVEVDDRSFGLRINFQTPHRLGLGTFVGSDNAGVPPEIDWRNLLATIGIESDQKVRVAKKRKQLNPSDILVEIADADVRNRLIVRDDSLVCLIALKGTVFGVTRVDNVSELDRLTETTITGGSGDGGYVVRSDWPRVERYAKRLAAWAFRPRKAVTMTLAKPDAAYAWAQIGQMIGTLTEPVLPNGDGTSQDAVALVCNTIIKRIHVQVGSSQTHAGPARITIQSGLPPMPQMRGGRHGAGAASSPSPASGGPVHPTIGGTLAQGIQRAQMLQIRDRAADQRRVVVDPRTRPGSQYTVVQVVGGNSLPVLGTPGIKRVTAMPAEIADAVLEESPTTEDGIGYGLNEDSNQLVLLHNAPPGLLKFDLWAGQRVLCKHSESIPITDSDPVRYAAAWTPLFIVG